MKENKNKGEVLKKIVTSLSLIVVIIGGFLFYFILDLGGYFDTSQKDLINNFEKNKEAFYLVENFVNGTDPSHRIRSIEFYINGSEENGSFSIKADRVEISNGYRNLEKWIPPNYITKSTPWTKKKFLELKEMLNKINCWSIKTGEPFEFEYEKSGDFYKLYQEPFDNNLFSDSCLFYKYNNRVIFEHRIISDFQEPCFK